MSNRYRAVITDGVKAFGIPDHIDNDPSAWEWFGAGPTTDADLYYRYIPWVRRAIELIAGAADHVPWELQRGTGYTVDASANWENKLGYFDDPQPLIGLVIRSLLLYGRAYVLKERNRARVLRLRYLTPSSITWEIATNPAGEQLVNKTTGKPLLKFTRTVNNQKFEYTEEDIVYFWLPDPSVEIGPPESWPAKSAVVASNVLYQFDTILGKFFERGMIKPLIITASGNPPKEERERIESWFTRLFQGVKNAFQVRLLNADKLTVQDIASDFSGVADLEISADKRHDIGAAFGIPDALLFSDAANYSTAQVDQKNFYDQTVIPLLSFVLHCLTVQLVDPLKLVTLENTMDIYQEDENARATSLAALTGALQQPEAFLAAALILGYEIPDEARRMIESMIGDKEENREQMAEQLGQGEQPEQMRPEMQPDMEEPEESPADNELKRWKRSALQSVKKGKRPKAWAPEFIPAAQAAQIAAALEGATDSAGVVRAFRVEAEPEHNDLAERVEALAQLVKGSLWAQYP